MTPIATWRLANVHAAFQNREFTVVAFTGTDDVRARFVPAAKITPFLWIKIWFPIRRLEGEAALLDAGEPED